MRTYLAWVSGALFGQFMLAVNIGGFHPTQFTLDVWWTIIVTAGCHVLLVSERYFPK